MSESSMEPAPATPDPIRLHKELTRAWSNPPGIGRLSAVNHTTVGRRFIVTAFVFFAVGGVLAMLIRAQLATPHSAFLGPDIYNQVFTMHGTVMMFLFAIPMIEGVSFYLLPKMLGARDMAFPRLSAYGYYCYLFGGLIILVAMVFGFAPDSGWFMYTPLSSSTYTPGINPDVWLIGVTFVEISAMTAAVEIIVSILKLRAPGMSLDRMPLFAWYMLVTAFMMLVGFPPLIVASVLLEVERAFGLPFFDPTRGGDSLLWQHLFWLFGHPEVYIIFLPAAGVVSTVLPALARREIIGYLWIVVSIVALAFLSFGLWVHHMFTVGIPHLALAFFSAASVAVAVPTAVQIFAWIGTLAAGRPQLKLPMLYLLGFFFIFVAGGLTGVMLAIVPFNWQVHDTQFVVAHLHYVLVGGFIFPMMAGAYYWLPLFTGRSPRYALGVTAFWLIFIGFNLTFLVMHWTGLVGMPRRVYTYSSDAGWTLFNLLSSIGGFLLAMGFALFAVDLFMQWRFGRRAVRNPWRAGTLEWSLAKPSPLYAFSSIPDVSSRSPLSQDPDIGRGQAAGSGYLAFARHGWMETLGVDVTTGRIEQVIRLPQPTYLPLVSAALTAVFFLGVLFKLYAVALIGAAAAIASFLMWTRSTDDRTDRGLMTIGRGERALSHLECPNAPSWWAMAMLLVADACAFASLAYGLLFLWVVAPQWPPPELIAPGVLAPLLVLAGLAAAGWGSHRAFSVKVIGAARPRELRLLLAAAGHAVTLVGLVLILSAIPDPTRHAHEATAFVLAIYAAIHVGVGLLFALYGIWRSRAGYVSLARSLDLRVPALWHGYTVCVGVGCLLLVCGLPWAMQSGVLTR